MSSAKLPETVPAQPDRPADATPSYVAPGLSFRSVTDKISAMVLSRPTGPAWLAGMAFNTALVVLFVAVVTYLLVEG